MKALLTYSQLNTQTTEWTPLYHSFTLCVSVNVRNLRSRRLTYLSGQCLVTVSSWELSNEQTPLQ